VRAGLAVRQALVIDPTDCRAVLESMTGHQDVDVTGGLKFGTGQAKLDGMGGWGPAHM
jgi:hypothetical protein